MAIDIVQGNTDWFLAIKFINEQILDEKDTARIVEYFISVYSVKN